MSEWRDISTAPKDGTFIDLWASNGIYGREFGEPYACRFEECLWLSEDTQCPRWVSRSSGDTVEDGGWVVTHWLPILPGPTP